MRSLKWALLVLVSAASAARADDPPKARAPAFSVENLAVDGHVKGLDEVDLDGDGKLDLIAAVVKGEGENAVRSLQIFWNRGGSFASKPDLTITLDADLCAYDLADVDGKPGAELVAITSSGVRAHSLSGRVLGPNLDLVLQPTLFVRPPREELVRFHLVQPLGARRAPVLLVPGLGTLSLYRREGARFVRISQLQVEMDTTIDHESRGDRDKTQLGIESFAVNARFPSIDVADLDGDGRLDLLLAHDDEVQGFLQAADGTFPSTPSFHQRLQLKAKGDGEAASEDSDSEGKRASSQLRLVDVDGDGRADIVLTTTNTEGITSASTRVALFLGAPGGFHERPDQVIRNEGASFVAPQLADLTGKGHLDLIVPSFKLGIFAIIRVLTSKSIKVSFLLYPLGADHRFAEKPSASRELTFKVEFSAKQDLQAVDMYGDYLGDKQLDLAFGTEENELSIYGPGDAGQLFADDAMAKIAVRAYGDLDSVDLDGQGRCDMVLHYSATHGHESEIAVVHNHGVR